jgi:Raf kinase inhibitor-like YbhB/YbcL family protein
MAIKPSLKFTAIGVAVLLGLALIALFVLRERRRADIAEGQTSLPLVVKSSSFSDGGTIPKKYTCLGENLSPALEFDSPPVGTKSIAIVMDDLDSPFGFVHWLVYNIPGQAHAISEGASSQKALPTGATEGLGTMGTSSYAGPCPPSSTPHRYVIRVYALATDAPLGPGITKRQLASAVKGQVLAEGQWTGVFSRHGT